MKKINKIALVLGSVFFSSISAHAMPGPYDQSPYVTANVGIYGAGQDNNPFSNLFDNDDDLRATGRIAVGYQWRVEPTFLLAIEGGINGFQDHEQDATVITTDDTTLRYHRFSVDVLAVFDYYLVPCVDLFIKAGPAYVHQEASAEHEVADVSAEHSSVTGKLVVGAGYAFNRKISANLTLSHEFEKDEGYRDVDSFPSASSLMLGIKYNF